MRKEIYLTQDMQAYQRLKNLLVANGIETTSKITDSSNPNSGFWSILGASRRSSRGLAFENKNYQKFYYIYVKKKDYERALEIVHKFQR